MIVEKWYGKKIIEINELLKAINNPFQKNKKERLLITKIGNKKIGKTNWKEIIIYHLLKQEEK